jgi:uncharacterized tellurite resistance protein B-like protein
MDTSRINDEIVNLLSQITGQKLSQRDVTPSVLFLANLVIVLLAVIFVDGIVTEEEKQTLLTILYRFSTPESEVRRLTLLMIKGVRQHQLYKKSKDLLTLANPLSDSQRLLLISFGYEMSAADGKIDSREKKYLEVVAKRLNINPQHLVVLEAAFTHHGKVESNALIAEVNNWIQESISRLQQAEDNLDYKIKLCEIEKQKILEQIGEVSGRDVKIRLLANQLIEQVLEQANASWRDWYEDIGERMANKSQYWYSAHSPVWSQDKLIQDYIKCFIKDFSAEIDDWSNQQLKDVIISEKLEILDANIEYELKAIQGEFMKLDMPANTSFSEQLQLSINDISDKFMGLGGIGGGIGIGGFLAAGLLAFTGIGFMAAIVASVAAAIAGSFGLGMLDIDGLHEQIKMKVLDIGFQKFESKESIDKVSEKLDEIINTVFNSRVEFTSEVIAQAISFYENLLQEQEKVQQEIFEEQEAHKVGIFQNHQELQRLQYDMARI